MNIKKYKMQKTDYKKTISTILYLSNYILFICIWSYYIIDCIKLINCVSANI